MIADATVWHARVRGSLTDHFAAGGAFLSSPPALLSPPGSSIVGCGCAAEPACRPRQERTARLVPLLGHRVVVVMIGSRKIV